MQTRQGRVEVEDSETEAGRPRPSLFPGRSKVALALALLR